MQADVVEAVVISKISNTINIKKLLLLGAIFVKKHLILFCTITALKLGIE